MFRDLSGKSKIKTLFQISDSVGFLLNVQESENVLQIL